MIKKAILDKRDPYLALLEYWNTPISDTIGSPAQRFMGQRTKTLLPTLLRPKLINPQSIVKELRDRKSRQKFNYDCHTIVLRPFAVGDRVMMSSQAEGKWEPATVIAISQDGPRSYIVNTPGGLSYHWNWNQHLTVHMQDNTTLLIKVLTGWRKVIYLTKLTLLQLKCQQSKAITSHLPYNSSDHREQFGSHQGTLTQTIELWYTHTPLCTISYNCMNAYSNNKEIKHWCPRTTPTHFTTIM